MRRGFTLAELIVVVVVIVIMAALFFSVIGGSSNYQHTETFDAEVTRKYEYDERGESGDTVFRVDVRRQGSEFIETLTNEDDAWQSKYNSGTIYANLAEGDWYQFDTRGKRNERWSTYPNIITVTPIGKPLE